MQPAAFELRTERQLRQIALAALTLRVASVYLIHDYSSSDGLIGYGPDVGDNCRRAGTFPDSILRGAKPGGLPFEQADGCLLAINLKTAKTLGTTILQSVLLRADAVMQ